MESALKTFFTSSKFAVVGASSDPTKFGHKVFVWYLTHSLPVTPINPRVPSINAGPRKTTFSTLTSPLILPAPTDTSLSIITPPKATLAVLKEAKEAGIPAVWLQPGTYDDAVLKYAKEEYKGVVIGGMDGGTGGDEGWCVLVDGEGGLDIAGRGWERVRL